MRITPRHARPRRTVGQRVRDWHNREPLNLDVLDGVGHRWTPADDLAVITAWRDAWADDPDRTTRREAFTR